MDENSLMNIDMRSSEIQYWVDECNLSFQLFSTNLILEGDVASWFKRKCRDLNWILQVLYEDETPYGIRHKMCFYACRCSMWEIERNNNDMFLYYSRWKLFYNEFGDYIRYGKKLSHEELAIRWTDGPTLKHLTAEYISDILLLKYGRDLLPQRHLYSWKTLGITHDLDYFIYRMVKRWGK